MKFISTKIEDVFIIEPEKKGDDRGWFMRTFDLDLFKENIPSFDCNWVQINQSYNKNKYTWRGFHYQMYPFEETKIVRCISGSVLDCVLDLREYSKTYLQTLQIELSSFNNTMLYIPKGCAHGYLTLEDNCELIYFHDEYYNPAFESGVKFDDKKISFTLPFTPKIISDKDCNYSDL
jgi:dTDP-4-dehydrorhamnose 3,5-epimerase